MRRLLPPLLGLLAPVPAAAQDTPRLPDATYTPDQVGRVISPTMGDEHKNQPAAVDGMLLLAGNGQHELWDVSDPMHPARVSRFESPHHDGEAESHQLTFHRTADERTLAATISGRGVDLWDLTDAATPRLLSAVELEGVDYGDNSEAVWGVAWQGDVLYVGGTNTGLHVLDVSTPSSPVLVDRLPTSALGGVSAGPLWAVGNVLVVTTPKNHAGVATLDIGDPLAPSFLDAVVPEVDSYIGGLYGPHAYLLTPLRTYDVLSDPSSIQLLGSSESPASEYVSFGDDFLFLGGMRPTPGVYKVPLGGDPSALDFSNQIEGRYDGPAGGVLTDDQFNIPVGNLLVLCDDEIRFGCALAPHAAARDAIPPRVITVQPPDGAAAQPITTRIGLSMSDQIDLASLTPESVILRDLDSGLPVPGSWSLSHTVVSFSPDEPLAPDAVYEIELPAGGVTDLVGNGLATTFRSAFSTGPDAPRLHCGIEPLEPVEVGDRLRMVAEDAGPGATYSWTVDGRDAGTGDVQTVNTSESKRARVALTVSDGTRERTCTATGVIREPAADAPPGQASTVVVDPFGVAWVVNPDADTVSAVDLDTLAVVHEIRVGDRPRTLSLGADGALWVTGQDSDDLTRIDTATGEVLDTIALRYGARPYGVAVEPGGERVWVACEGTGEVLGIDTATREVVHTVKVGDDPYATIPIRGIAIRPDARRAWVTRFLSPQDEGELYELDLTEPSVRARLVLAKDPGPDENDAGRGVPNLLSTVAISPSGTRAVVPSKKDNTDRGMIRDGQPLDTDNTVRTIVSFLRVGDSPREDLDLRVDLDDHDMAYAAAWSPGSDLVFVVSQGSNQLDVLDAATGEIVSGASTGLAPNGVAVSADGRVVTQDLMSRTLTVFDATDLLAGRDTLLKRVGEVVTVSEEPLDEVMLLGKQIFYNARSREMSQDGYLSCATCHPDGGEDGRVWDFTDRGEGLRNTIDLRGRRGTGHGPLHWSANFDEVQDFEHDIRTAFGGGGLMSDELFHAEGRDEPLGGKKAGQSHRLDALALYVSSLDTYPRSPWRNPDGTLTKDAEVGRRLFERLDCGTCHSGPDLTDSAEGKRHDVGTLTQASGGRMGGELDGLDTPTLHGLHATGPWLHDGSAATVERAFLRGGHGDADRLDPRQQQQLAAYLLSLDGTIPEAAGCACDSGRGGLGPSLFGLLIAVGLRRRRRPRSRAW